MPRVYIGSSMSPLKFNCVRRQRGSEAVYDLIGDPQDSAGSAVSLLSLTRPELEELRDACNAALTPKEPTPCPYGMCEGGHTDDCEREHRHGELHVSRVAVRDLECGECRPAVHPRDCSGGPLAEGQPNPHSDLPQL